MKIRLCSEHRNPLRDYFTPPRVGANSGNPSLLPPHERILNEYYNSGSARQVIIAITQAENFISRLPYFKDMYSETVLSLQKKRQGEIVAQLIEAASLSDAFIQEHFSSHCPKGDYDLKEVYSRVVQTEASQEIFHNHFRLLNLQGQMQQLFER